MEATALDTIAGIPRTADAIDAACPQVDTLVHNAGLRPTRCVCNDDDLEQAFVVNHLAPFMLNHLRAPVLAAARGRVVQVTAGRNGAGRIDLDAAQSSALCDRARTLTVT